MLLHPHLGLLRQNHRRGHKHEVDTHHSHSVIEPLSGDVLGDEGTLLLQEQHSLQSLSCAVGNDPATVQCAEAETALQRQSVRVLLPCRAVTGRAEASTPHSGT